MRIFVAFLFIVGLISCNNKTKNIVQDEVAEWSQAQQLEINANHASPRMRYKLIQSKFRPMSDVWEKVEKQLGDFGESEYERLKPYIYERDIPSIQQNVRDGILTYEALTKWYIYRIMKYESNPETALHTVISLDENAIRKARSMDLNKRNHNHPIYGMPILLKDNINASGNPTTAGAVVLAANQTDDAAIVTNLKAHGAIILGKVNLSEWAYYFCDGCPLGYSAVGGQTLNPYGRFLFETGGSSAGSGVSIAANYATAAVGTETAGSILSPSAQNALVGLKPTIGLLSRSGIVPISSTLDTPGPMTKSIADNAILLSAMTGRDLRDGVTQKAPRDVDFLTQLDGVDPQKFEVRCKYQLSPGFTLSKRHQLIGIKRSNNC